MLLTVNSWDVGGSTREKQLQVTLYRLTNAGHCSWAHLILFFINVSLLVLNRVFCSFLRYRIYDLSRTFYTKPVWKIVNPQIEETVQFTALNASQEFLSYLQTNALIVDLWGLQGTLFTSSLAWCLLPSDIMSVYLGLPREGGREEVRVLTAKSHLLLGPWTLVHGGLYGLNLFIRHWGQTAERFFLDGFPPQHCRRLRPTELLSAGPHGHKWRPHHGGHQENFHSDGYRPGVHIYVANRHGRWWNPRW